MAPAEVRKVPTTCLTCRKRKVKCDGTRPNCLRCAKARLTCDGYPSATALPSRRKDTPEARGDHARNLQVRSSRIPLLPKRSTPLDACPTISRPPGTVPFSSKQALYADVYRYKVIPKLPDREFWHRIVQREAVSDESIRDSVVALGALWLAQDRLKTLRRTDHSQAQVFDSDNPFPKDEIVEANYREAARSHTHAMSLFRKRLIKEGSTMTPRSIFIATYLFVMFEQNQGNSKEADRLLVFAMNILYNHLAVFKATRQLPYQLVSALAARMDDEGLLEAERRFTHMALVNPNGQRLSPAADKWSAGKNLAQQIMLADVPGVESSVNYLLAEWDLFISRTGLWIWRFAPESIFVNPDAEGRAICSTALTLNRRWRKVFEDKLATETRSEHRVALESTLTNIIMSFTCWASFTDPTEMAWDAFIADYQAIMDLIDLTKGRSVLPRFESFHIDLPHLLYFILQKCRDRDTRQRALGMLRDAVRADEGDHLKVMLAACEAHVSYEELGRDHLTGVIPASKRFLWTGQSSNQDGTSLVLTLTSALPDSTGKRTTEIINVGPGQLNK